MDDEGKFLLHCKMYIEDCIKDLREEQLHYTPPIMLEDSLSLEMEIRSLQRLKHKAMMQKYAKVGEVRRKVYAVMHPNLPAGFRENTSVEVKP